MPRPEIGDSLWAEWLSRFPGRPRRDRFDLRWAAGRIGERFASLPDRTLLQPDEREAVRQWINDYRVEFELDQEDPVQIVDPLAASGVLAMLTGLVAAPFVPVVTIGAFVASSGLLGASISSSVDKRRRRKLVSEIKRRLHDIDRALR